MTYKNGLSVQLPNLPVSPELLRVPTTKRRHTTPHNPGEFRGDQLKSTRTGGEKTSRGDAVTTPGPEATRGREGVTRTPRESHTETVTQPYGEEPCQSTSKPGQPGRQGAGRTKTQMALSFRLQVSCQGPSLAEPKGSNKGRAPWFSQAPRAKQDGEGRERESSRANHFSRIHN